MSDNKLIYEVRQDYIVRLTAPSGKVNISAMCNGLEGLLRFIEDGLQANCKVEVQAVFYAPFITKKEALAELNKDES